MGAESSIDKSHIYNVFDSSITKKMEGRDLQNLINFMARPSVVSDHDNIGFSVDDRKMHTEQKNFF